MHAETALLPLPPGPEVKRDPMSALRFIRDLQADMVGNLGHYFDTYGDVTAIAMGSLFLLVSLRHPEHIHRVLVEEPEKFDKGQTYAHPLRGLRRFLGDGLIVTDGDFWKRQRKLVAPALHARRVEAYAAAMVALTERALAGWRDGETRDVDEAMMSLTLQIVARTLFDADVEGDVARIGHAMDVLHGVLSLNLFPTWIPTAKNRRENAAVRDLDAIIYPLIRARRAAGDDRGDLFSMLLLARDDDGQPMSDRQVRDETATLFLAGHETTANALNWTWVALAQNPDAEAKLHAELDAVLAGRVPTLDDLKRLPYTEMVIKETLRLYPPAHGFTRRPRVDWQVGGYRVPKGSEINIATIHLHRDPRWWHEPLRFLPERFAPENEAGLTRGAYLPFGAGPRVCIGNRFAMMEACLILATIAQRYRLRLPPGHVVALEPVITLRPKGGLPMRVERRAMV